MFSSAHPCPYRISTPTCARACPRANAPTRTTQNFLTSRAVPLAPLFASTTPPPASTSTTTNDNENGDNDTREGVCPGGESPSQQQEAALVPPAVLREFQQALEACTKAADGATGAAAAATEGGASTVTLKLLDDLLEQGKLKRLTNMFLVSWGGGGGDETGVGEEEEEAVLRLVRMPEKEEWSRCVCMCVCLSAARCSHVKIKVWVRIVFVATTVCAHVSFSSSEHLSLRTKHKNHAVFYHGTCRVVSFLFPEGFLATINRSFGRSATCPTRT